MVGTGHLWDHQIQDVHSHNNRPGKVLITEVLQVGQGTVAGLKVTHAIVHDMF